MATVDRFLYPLVSTTLLLGVLLIWQRTYDQSCAALLSPAFVSAAVFYGLVGYRLERKRFALDYYLDPGSAWRGRFRGSWLPVFISLGVALPLAAIVSVFVALSRPTDWFFLAGAAVTAPFLCDALGRWPGRHLRQGVEIGGLGPSIAEILSVRLAGWVLLALLALAYVYFNYMRIGGPAYIYPDSLQLTVEAFTAHVGSACPVVDSGLRAATAVEGTLWYLVTGAATAAWMPDGIKVVVWFGFFLNAALAMTGFVRGLEGSILAIWRVVPRIRESPLRFDKGVTDVE